MPTIAVINFNIVCATLGGFITLFGLVSYLFKEKFYLSEALISLVAGLIFSPHATNLIRPEEYALGNEITLETITWYFTRLVLGVQLVLAGVQLPRKYLWKEWKSLALLLGPGMTVMWICTSLLVYALVPHLPFLHALAVGACVTPTDPVLSNSIVKGKFADKNIPKELQKIIIAESGANDGLGYPFLFLPLYLIKHVGYGGLGQDNSARSAMGEWFGETWGYTILLSIVYGATVGWIAKELLHWAEERKYVDRESFLVFAITLALFITGTVGMIGSDDVLACFIAGNTFTWDDWFRLETLDDSFQPTIDMLLNVAVFIWFGAVCPWYSFAHSDVIPIYRLIFLGILVLLLRRPPIVFAMHKKIHQIEEPRQAFFVGFFGPIGVSAIFYLYVSLDFLRHITVDGVIRPDAARLMEVMNVVVWFLSICSIVVHGLSIPLGKLGFYLPRTISQAVSQQEEPEPFHIRERAVDGEHAIERSLRHRSGAGTPINGNATPVPRPVFRIGRSIIRPKDSKSTNPTPSDSPNVMGARSPAPMSPISPDSQNHSPVASPTEHDSQEDDVTAPALMIQRAIRFPDEQNMESENGKGE
ncbi:CPA1 family monovalent cation:H+ antiporter [Lepidopterella palustris CBS 459.81]|uniref:CPA1 family monovalent cation:H+ antiporter n=1 Tax=Lepidopterella palustris CBS 459.81 TaxID=1314670 RepID=A0A8E2JDE8_9PEZI|nr:CPA1 family monovalent cation:H+ antiporter [Lepidopterella palustris CBS 459.81]